MRIILSIHLSTKKNISRLLIVICILVSILLLCGLCKPFASSRYSIYFYNPEININNFVFFKTEFDKYLSNYGPYRFQPFSDKATFEEFIMQKNDGVYLLSSWHYHDLAEKFPMESVLVGTSKGKSTQKRVLTTNNITNIESLKGKKVASVGNEGFTKSVLIEMLGEGNKDIIDSLKILNVPKDIDALIAVGFGVANSALTTEGSLKKLAAINPQLYRTLKPLATGKQTLLPIVAAPKQTDDDIGMLLTVIENMGQVPEGKEKLKMLGIDGWAKLSKTEMMSLETR